MTTQTRRTQSEPTHVRNPSPVSVFFGNPLAVLGVALLTVFGLMVVAHPLLMATAWDGQESIYDPVTGYDAPIAELVVVEEVTDPTAEIELTEARLSGNISAVVGDTVQVRQQPAPPSSTHWLGTDVFGRDVFSMLLAGAWPTFLVGVSAALVTAVIGIAVASVSAVAGPRVDATLSVVSDSLLLMPAPLAMIVLGAGAFGDFLTPIPFGVIYGLLAGASTAAIVIRSHAIATMKRGFIDSARVSGVSRWRLARHHLIPHLVPLAAVTMVTAVVGAVVAHGFASWLAFNDELTTWGAMMYIAVGFSQTQGGFGWNVLLSGAVSISLFCSAFYLISLGLRDVAFGRGEP